MNHVTLSLAWSRRCTTRSRLKQSVCSNGPRVRATAGRHAVATAFIDGAKQVTAKNSLSIRSRAMQCTTRRYARWGALWPARGCWRAWRTNQSRVWQSRNSRGFCSFSGARPTRARRGRWWPHIFRIGCLMLPGARCIAPAIAGADESRDAFSRMVSAVHDAQSAQTVGVQ